MIYDSPSPQRELRDILPGDEPETDSTAAALQKIREELLELQKLVPITLALKTEVTELRDQLAKMTRVLEEMSADRQRLEPLVQPFDVLLNSYRKEDLILSNPSSSAWTDLNIETLSTVTALATTLEQKLKIIDKLKSLGILDAMVWTVVQRVRALVKVFEVDEYYVESPVNNI